MGFNDVTPKVANSVALALNSPRKKNNANRILVPYANALKDHYIAKVPQQ